MEQQAESLIRLEGVSKVFLTDEVETHALATVHLQINRGEYIAIAGPSGCGKTTLLNAVAGFHDLSSGRIALDGVEIAGEGVQAEPGPDRVVVFQNGALFPWMTALDNVMFGPLAQGALGPAQARDKARAMMADAGLADAQDMYPAQMSSGIRRRVEIVRAMMNDPAILLLDEPYRAMDSLTRAMMHEALLEMHARRPVTILFITHDLEEAVFLGHRIVVMSARPCRPTLELDIDMPFPRKYAMTAGDAYRGYVQAALEAVHVEAVKSFAAGEKEAA